jgi:hypothetical protein
MISRGPATRLPFHNRERGIATDSDWGAIMQDQVPVSALDV